MTNKDKSDNNKINNSFTYDDAIIYNANQIRKKIDNYIIRKIVKEAKNIVDK